MPTNNRSKKNPPQWVADPGYALGEEVVVTESWLPVGVEVAGTGLVSREMIRAGTACLVDLDDPCLSHAELAQEMFGAMFQVILAEPELRLAYQKWLAGSAQRDSAVHPA